MASSTTPEHQHVLQVGKNVLTDMAGGETAIMTLEELDRFVTERLEIPEFLSPSANIADAMSALGAYRVYHAKRYPDNQKACHRLFYDGYHGEWEVSLRLHGMTQRGKTLPEAIAWAIWAQIRSDDGYTALGGQP